MAWHVCTENSIPMSSDRLAIESSSANDIEKEKLLRVIVVN